MTELASAARRQATVPGSTLFLTQDFPPDLGGIARLYGELCRWFPAGGVEVCTVATGAGAVVGPAEAAGAAVSAGAVGAAGAVEQPTKAPTTAPATPVPIHRMPFTRREAGRFTNVVRWARWTRRRAARGDIVVLQVGNIRPAGYVAAWVRRRLGIPYVVYVHGKDLLKEERKAGRSTRVRRTGRWVLGGADAIIANSRATAERAERLLVRLGVDPAGRVRVVHPGTDPERFRPDAEAGAAARRRLGLDGRRVLLSVTRLMPRKGIDTTLEAIARLAAERPDLVYVVAGDGPDRPRLEALASRLRVAERVRFLGAVSDAELPALYAASDIFVLPVRVVPEDDEIEGFGIVFCEAAAAGVAVVAGASGGVADAVRDGETGLLVAPGDAAALAGALGRLLDDDARRSALGAAGRRAVETYYHWRRAADDAWAVIEEVARSAGGAAALAPEEPDATAPLRTAPAAIPSRDDRGGTR